MTRRTWILGSGVLIVVMIGAALMLLRAYRHAPLQQASARTCIGCVTWFWNGTASVRANRLSGDYRFTDDVGYLVSFSGGSVRIDGRELSPGCHEGRASDGDRLAIVDGREVRLRVPAPVDGCADAGDG